MITLDIFRAMTPFITLSLMIGVWTIGWLVRRLIAESSQHFADLKKELKHKIDQRSWELEKRMDKLERDLEKLEASRLVDQKYLYEQFVSKEGFYRTVGKTENSIGCISKIQPHIKNGIIRFRRNQTQLIDQLKYFPKADHDDGPDVLEMVFSLITHHTTFGPRVRNLAV